MRHLQLLSTKQKSAYIFWFWYNKNAYGHSKIFGQLNIETFGLHAPSSPVFWLMISHVGLHTTYYIHVSISHAEQVNNNLLTLYLWCSLTEIYESKKSKEEAKKSPKMCVTNMGLIITHKLFGLSSVPWGYLPIVKA